jgi:hypothetical protein
MARTHRKGERGDGAAIRSRRRDRLELIKSTGPTVSDDRKTRRRTSVLEAGFID